uniref:Divalent-cation tolerance protein CutA n=1 Tax=Neospora caninum (strain Liverpool) TaxID=572307 RepID=A0A0F7UKN0_NEOCL|nr:TPA: Divalent-cation tolerance protein CutA [Neospora caninum Liverpool]
MVPRLVFRGLRPVGLLPDALFSFSLLALCSVLCRLAASRAASAVSLPSASLPSLSTTLCSSASPVLPDLGFASTLGQPARTETTRVRAEVPAGPESSSRAPSASRDSASFSRKTAPGSDSEIQTMEGEAAAQNNEVKNAVQVAYVTCKDKSQAEEVASNLVASRLAACVNIVPGITSIYEWEGKVEKDEEVLLIIKTRKELASELVAAVRKLHSYDVPEVIFLDVVGGNEPYLDWVKRNTQRTT